MTGHALERRHRFRALYDRGYDAVLGYARRRTNSAADADDVVSETFLTAWRKLDQAPSESNEKPWLYGIARRVLANQRRGARRRRALTERIRADALRIEGGPGSTSLSARVAAAFERLPSMQQELIALAYWEDLTPAEIAVALGCSRNAARIRLHRARRRLARELDAGVHAQGVVTALSATTTGTSTIGTKEAE